MKQTAIITLGVCLAIVPAAFAQQWEVGGAIGGGFYTSQAVTGPAGSADAKFKTGLAGSAWLGNNNAAHFGGEFRYDFQFGDMKLSGNGVEAGFAAQTHQVHYDFLWHAASTEARVRPFVAAGAGIKVYRGTGTETLTQPLSKLALLTKTQDVRPLVSLGAGIKFRVSDRIDFRVEVHDYLTPFPKEVITPALGASVSGWIHDIVPSFGLSFLF
ncbi:MAG: outer membrane beta-barrel protein [Bryobacteraceae bacterium]